MCMCVCVCVYVYVYVCVYVCVYVYVYVYVCVYVCVLDFKTHYDSFIAGNWPKLCGRMLMQVDIAFKGHRAHRAINLIILYYYY